MKKNSNIGLKANYGMLLDIIHVFNMQDRNKKLF